MKKIAFYTLLSLSLYGVAQVETISLNKEMIKGNQPCYELSIEDVVHKDLRKSWIKKMDAFTKVKPKLEDLDMDFYNVEISDLKCDTLNVFSRILQRDKAVIIQAFFETEGGFISETNTANQEHERVLELLNDFGKESYNAFYLKKVEAENKILKKKMSELDRLNNSIIKQTKLINKRETSIRNNKVDIVNVIKGIDLSKTEVLNQSTVVSQLSATSPVYKVESKKLKSLQKKSDKLISQKANLEKQIQKFGVQIETARATIKQAKLDIVDKESEIIEQKDKLNQLNEKII